MKLLLEWNSPSMEWDYIKRKEVPSRLDRENIFLSVGIKGLPEQESYLFLNLLEEKMNEELADVYGRTGFARCSGYGDTEDGVLYDTCGWKRDFGSVAEQKQEIIRTIRGIYLSLKKTIKTTGIFVNKI